MLTKHIHTPPSQTRHNNEMNTHSSGPNRCKWAQWLPQTTTTTTTTKTNVLSDCILFEIWFGKRTFFCIDRNYLVVSLENGCSYDYHNAAKLPTEDETTKCTHAWVEQPKKLACSFIWTMNEMNLIPIPSEWADFLQCSNRPMTSSDKQHDSVDGFSAFSWGFSLNKNAATFASVQYTVM